MPSIIENKGGDRWKFWGENIGVISVHVCCVFLIMIMMTCAHSPCIEFGFDLIIKI